MNPKLQTREVLSQTLNRAQTLVFTNGCFDILHAGHVQLLAQAKNLGDVLVVGLNSDASVRRLKGHTRPIHDQIARAQVLAALQAVDYVVIFDEDTPMETLDVLKPKIHVKGGDYDAQSLPETALVRKNGGEVVILPALQGFSTTQALEKSRVEVSRTPRSREKEVVESAFNLERSVFETSTLVMIPARFASTRFPGKPLAVLGEKTVIARVVEAVLSSKCARPVVVATDDARIANEITANFSPSQAVVQMTDASCHTGTDRLAQATLARLGTPQKRVVIVNVQGDEPFVDAAHVNALIDLMSDETLQMATLATPILESALESDPNVVKVAVSSQNRALYFSRSPIPHDRDKTGAKLLRHLGIYAYDARWLLEMASLAPSPLEEIEKLEQLRALEHGVPIGVAIVHDVVPIAIDTPQDLQRAEAYLQAI